MPGWGLVVDGRPMVAAHGIPKLSWRIRGAWDAEWAMLPGDHGIGQASRVEWWRSGRRVWSGRILDADPASGAYVAEGLVRKASNFPALAPGPIGPMHHEANFVVASNLLGLGWAGHEIPGSYIPAKLISIADQLDQAALDAGKWWTLGRDGIVRLVDVQTEPRWLLPVDSRAKDTGEGWPTRVVVTREYDGDNFSIYTTLSRDPVLRDQYGDTWEWIDATDRGPISAAQAANIGNKALNRIAKPTPAGDLALAGLLHIGGTKADPAAVAPGDVIRLRSTVERGGEIDLTVGTVAHDDGRWTATPLGAPPRGMRRIAEYLAASR